MQQQLAKLPMAGLRAQIAEALAGSDAVVISGETGSGKTTQVTLQEHRQCYSKLPATKGCCGRDVLSQRPH
jgi:HrpA-like RNA helicase